MTTVGSWHYETRDGIGHLTLVRPPVNALTTADWLALPALLADIEREPISVLVATGDGRHFCAGNDKNEFARDVRQADRVTVAVARGLETLATLPLPVIAGVRGAALGSGFMIASVCDARICTTDAIFGLPEIRVGAYGGYSIARRVLPAGIARTMVLGGAHLDARRAHQLGYVLDLHETPAELETALAEMATAWAGSDREMLRAAKDTFHRVEGCDLWSGYELERGLAVRHMTLNS